MAKLTRYLQKIFANNSNQVGVFGTGTDKETSKNVETLQSADYENGWSSAIITNKNYPIWQEMDGVQYGLSYQLKYLFQNGIPEWLSTETYYTNSYCRYGSDIYYSLQDDNTNHNPALNDGYWIPLLNDLSNKADIDLANVNNLGTSRGAGWAMPSDTYVDLTLGANGSTYTAPSNGYVVAGGRTTATNGGLSLQCVDINTGIGGVGIQVSRPNANNTGVIFIPVKKNGIFSLSYNNFNVTYFRFYYAVGSESEAS